MRYARQKFDQSASTARQISRSSIRHCFLAFLAGAIHSGTASAGDPNCTPKLTVQRTKLTELRPPALMRFWFAVIAVDASACTASAGQFDVVITRYRENGPDLTFRERFVWTPPSIEIAVEFTADESVGSFWLENVTSCPCRQLERGSRARPD